MNRLVAFDPEMIFDVADELFKLEIASASAIILMQKI